MSGAARGMIGLRGAPHSHHVTAKRLEEHLDPKQDRRKTPHRPPTWWVVGAGYLFAFAFGAGYALFIKRYGDWNVGAQWEREILIGVRDRGLSRVGELLIDAAPWVGTNLTLFPLAALIAVWLIRSRRRMDLAVWLMVVELGCLSLNWLLKHAFVRDRPELFAHVGWYGWGAYPSGHAMASIAVLGTIALMLERERGWRWPLVVVLAIALLNAYGRLAHGVHWPSDVLAGAGVGMIWLLAAAVAFDGLPKRRRSDRPRERNAI